MADAHIRVRSATPVAQLASAIANRVYEGSTVVLAAIGAAAVSQAVKAIAVASGFTTATAGTPLSAKPSIEDVPGDDGPTTRILIRVFPDQPVSLQAQAPPGYSVTHDSHLHRPGVRQAGQGQEIMPGSLPAAMVRP